MTPVPPGDPAAPQSRIPPSPGRLPNAHSGAQHGSASPQARTPPPLAHPASGIPAAGGPLGARAGTELPPVRPAEDRQRTACPVPTHPHPASRQLSAPRTAEDRLAAWRSALGARGPLGRSPRPPWLLGARRSSVNQAHQEVQRHIFTWISSFVISQLFVMISTILCLAAMLLQFM